MSENDFECFASSGMNSLQTPCSIARTRDIHGSCQTHVLVVQVAQADGEVGLPCNDCSRQLLVLRIRRKHWDIAAAKR